jgi:predicted PurR-regulated permease PerM
MNFAKWISFSFVVIILYIFWQIRLLLLLLLTAVVLAIALNILVGKLEQWNLKRSYALGLSTTLLLSLLIIFIWLVVPSLVAQFQELIKLVPEGLQKLITIANQLKEKFSPELNNSLPNMNQIALQLKPLFNELLAKGLTVVSGFLGGLLSSLLLLALTLMFLVEPLPYRHGFIRLFPYFYRSRIEQILSRCEDRLEEWLTDIFLKIVIVTILTFFALLILGIPLVLAQSVLAGILAFIPYIGPIIGVISPVAIAMLSSAWKPWLVLIIYITIHQVAENKLIPMLRTNRVILAPANVLIGEIFFAGFLGFLGLFLALPLTIITEILIKEILINDILDQWQS